MSHRDSTDAIEMPKEDRSLIDTSCTPPSNTTTEHEAARSPKGALIILPTRPWSPGAERSEHTAVTTSAEHAKRFARVWNWLDTISDELQPTEVQLRARREGTGLWSGTSVSHHEMMSRLSGQTAVQPSEPDARDDKNGDADAVASLPDSEIPSSWKQSPEGTIIEEDAQLSEGTSFEEDRSLPSSWQPATAKL